MPIFLVQSFLLFGLAALVPIFLHFSHRRRPQPLPFSTLRFLQEAISKSRRSRQVTQYLTLLMRILILLLLAAAFAQPQIRFHRFVPGNYRNVLIVLDASASMQTVQGDKTGFELARAWAEIMLTELKDGDRIGILAPGSQEPRVVFPLVSDLQAAKNALKTVQPGFDQAALPECLRDFLDKSVPGLQNLEIHLFSDMQKSAWGTSALPPLQTFLEDLHAAIFFNRVNDFPTGDCSISSARFQPAAILPSGSVQAAVTLQSNAQFVGANVVRLHIADHESSHIAVELMAHDSQSVVLSGAANGEQAQVTGKLTLENDAYQLNNEYFFSLPRLAGVPALLVHGDSDRDTFFLRRALQPGGRSASVMMPKTASWQEFLAGDHSADAAWLICNPPEIDGTASAKIKKFLASGGTVVIFPGENNSLSNQAIKQFPGWEKVTLTTKDFPELTRMEVNLAGATIPLTQRLQEALPPPWGFTVRRYLLAETLSDTTEALLQFQPPGHPFFIRGTRADSNLWLCLVSANRDWSDWPMTPFFLVLTQELTKEIAGGRLQSHMTTINKPLLLNWPGNATQMQLQMIDPTGKSSQWTATREQGDEAVKLENLHMPGIYSVTDGQHTSQIAVNVDEEERDLSTWTNAELLASCRTIPTAHANDHTELRRQINELRQGSPLWPLLLSMAFTLSMLEVLFANRRSRATSQPRLLGAALRQGGARS